MQHDYGLVFETDNEYWTRVLEIFEKNEKYPKKVVSNRNLHHKFPRSFSKMLGEPVDNDSDNLISLSLADHFLVHYYYYLLAKKGFRQRMATAFTFMAKKGLKFMTPDTAEQMAKDYEEARAIANQQISDANKGKEIKEETKVKMSVAKKGKKFTEEHKKKLSEVRKGKPFPHKGHSQTVEARTKMSTAKKGMKIWSEADKAKMSMQRKGKTLSKFGDLFKERYGITQTDNPSLYYKENKYYQRHGCLRPADLNN